MPRLCLRHVTRWILIGFIGMYAIGGFPAIAAACEGGGEIETELVTEKGQTKGPLTLSTRNPFELLAEVVRLIGDPGSGPFLAGGTCVAGAHFGSLAICTAVQDEPDGGDVLWREL